MDNRKLRNGFLILSSRCLYSFKVRKILFDFGACSIMSVEVVEVWRVCLNSREVVGLEDGARCSVESKVAHYAQPMLRTCQVLVAAGLTHL